MAYCWGRNTERQLGNGAATGNSLVPGAVSGSPVAVSGGLSFTALTAGSSHPCALTSAGMVYCWGDNYAGQLGLGTFGYATSPVAVAP